MADTGAPWNIPYVEPSDLVRNYPAAAEELADAIAAGLTAAGNAGIGSNVVSTTKTDTFTTTSTTFVDLTGLTAAITPTSDTAKVLVLYSIVVGSSDGTGGFVRLRRGATDIAISTTASLNVSAATRPASNADFRSISGWFLDSPATDAATTYSMHIRAAAGTFTVNRRGLDNDFGSISTLTVIEVAV